jgi:multimeric flavodoxin WrbA
MKVIAVNGSPRKNWNTAQLLAKALEGAAAKGAKTELVHLYDLDFKGCHSCFACKLIGGKSYGQCNIADDLKPILRKIETADALILGSPIYFGMVSGEMRSFMERLMFQYLIYDTKHSSLRKKDIPTAFIYTMNITESGANERSYPATLGMLETSIQRNLSGREVPTLWATDTCQFDDYSKYESGMFDGNHKLRRRREEFPKDCERAFTLGGSL